MLKGANGVLALFNDMSTAPYMTAAQATVGIIDPLGISSSDTSILLEAIYWQDGYWINILYEDAYRNNFNSTNCRNGQPNNPATFTNAAVSCNILAVYQHNFFLGAAVKGCIAYAAPAYALSSTIASRPYARNNTGGIVAQAYTDFYTGDEESNGPGPGLASQPPGQTTGGSTIELTFTSATAPPTVGMNLGYGVATGITVSGITVPAETVVTSVTQDTSSTCVTGFCYIVGFGPNPMSGGAIPATLRFFFQTWTGSGSGAPPPISPWPLVPPAGAFQCPAEGLSANPAIMNSGATASHVLYFYSGAVAADHIGDPYGTIIRNYFENFNNSPNPGGVKPGGNLSGPYSSGYSPECAGSSATWDTSKEWPNDVGNANSPQFFIEPVGAPLTDSAGRPTGCH